MAMGRVERIVEAALAALLAALALYAAWSGIGSARRWGVSAWAVPLALLWAGGAVLALRSGGGRLRRGEWAALGLAALALRLASLALVAGRVSTGDSHWYVVLARNLLAGRGLGLVEPAMGVEVRAFFPPAYPLLLAGWGAVAGLGGGALLALSTLLDVAAAALIARVGRQLGVGRAGIAAAWLYLLWPPVVLSAPLAQKESLEIVLVLLLVDRWLAARAAAGWRCWAPLGLAAGALALTQPGLLALAPAYGIAVIGGIRWRRLLAVGLPAASVAALVLLPWWWRNWQVLGAFVPLTSAGGLSLWVGNNPHATGGWVTYPPAWRGLPELAYARVARDAANAWIAAHPIECGRLLLTKFVRAFGEGTAGVDRLVAMRPAVSATIPAGLWPLCQATEVVLLGGAALALRRRGLPSPLVALLVTGMLQCALLGAWFEFGERHRMFLTPLLLLAIAAGRGAIRRRTVPAAAASARPAA